MGGWNCGGSDLNYPKIGIEMAIINSKIGIAMERINWRENLLNWRTWVSGSVSTCIMG